VNGADRGESVEPEPAAEPRAPHSDTPWRGPAPLEPLRLARTARFMVIGLTAALAVVLLTSGHVLVGVLIGAMAAMRAAVLVSVGRRRAAMLADRRRRRARFQARAEASRAQAPRRR